MLWFIVLYNNNISKAIITKIIFKYKSNLNIINRNYSSFLTFKNKIMNKIITERYFSTNASARKIVFIFIVFEDFFNEEVFRSRDVVFKNLYKTIFIFDNIQWSEVCLHFKTKNIIISGGSNTKKHILNPIEFKFSIYLRGLGVTVDNVTNSFHNTPKEFSYPSGKKTIEELLNSKQELLNIKEKLNPDHESDTENPFMNNLISEGVSEKDSPAPREEELNINKASDGVIKEMDTTIRQSSTVRKGIKNNGLIDLRKLFNERFNNRYFHSTPSSNAESKNEWGDSNTLKKDQEKLDLLKNKIPLRLSEYLLSIRNILNNTKLNDDKSLFNTQSKIENM
jgi:hypothetical protein